MSDAPRGEITASRGTVAEVGLAFLKLGLTSFGGPVAHLGYFRDDLVVRRKWFVDAEYGDVVALCQFLPERSGYLIPGEVGSPRASRSSR